MQAVIHQLKVMLVVMEHLHHLMNQQVAAEVPAQLGDMVDLLEPEQHLL
jgi:hypothetical protein